VAIGWLQYGLVLDKALLEKIKEGSQNMIVSLPDFPPQQLKAPIELPSPTHAATHTDLRQYGIYVPKQYLENML